MWEKASPLPQPPDPWTLCPWTTIDQMLHPQGWKPTGKHLPPRGTHDARTPGLRPPRPLMVEPHADVMAASLGLSHTFITPEASCSLGRVQRTPNKSQNCRIERSFGGQLMCLPWTPTSAAPSPAVWERQQPVRPQRPQRPQGRGEEWPVGRTDTSMGSALAPSFLAPTTPAAGDREHSVHNSSQYSHSDTPPWRLNGLKEP